MRYRRSGAARAEAVTALKNSFKGWETRWEMLEDSAMEESVKKLEMQAMMHALDSGRMDSIDCRKMSNFVQGIIWAPLNSGQAREFVGLMWRRTLESAMSENTRAILQQNLEGNSEGYVVNSDGEQPEHPRGRQRQHGKQLMVELLY